MHCNSCFDIYFADQRCFFYFKSFLWKQTFCKIIINLAVKSTQRETQNNNNCFTIFIISHQSLIFLHHLQLIVLPKGVNIVFEMLIAVTWLNLYHDGSEQTKQIYNMLSCNKLWSPWTLELLNDRSGDKEFHENAHQHNQIWDCKKEEP